MPNHDQPFFPEMFHTYSVDENEWFFKTVPGAALRDVIAIEAMKVLLHNYINRYGEPGDIHELASHAYNVAGAMLLEKAKRENK